MNDLFEIKLNYLRSESKIATVWFFMDATGYSVLQDESFLTILSLYTQQIERLVLW